MATENIIVAMVKAGGDRQVTSSNDYKLSTVKGLINIYPHS